MYWVVHPHPPLLNAGESPAETGGLPGSIRIVVVRAFALLQKVNASIRTYNNNKMQKKDTKYYRLFLQKGVK